MSWLSLPIVFASLSVLLYVAIAVVLVVKWIRTRDIGIAWLGIAVVIWPWIAGLLRWGETIQIRRLVRHQTVGFFPFSLVEHGNATIGGLFTTLNSLQQLIGAGLLLIAVMYLYNGKNAINRIRMQVAPSHSEA
ncbi:MAG: hypothetical protein V4587_18195 [Acidobacteriota bacterium]